eukprot:m.251483 g.251483  ORF g.251483 m.251483 type:complete len:258 (+) comp17279_c0_seq1:140-913(+)
MAAPGVSACVCVILLATVAAMPSPRVAPPLQPGRGMQHLVADSETGANDVPIPAPHTAPIRKASISISPDAAWHPPAWAGSAIGAQSPSHTERVLVSSVGIAHMHQSAGPATSAHPLPALASDTDTALFAGADIASNVFSADTTPSATNISTTTAPMGDGTDDSHPIDTRAIVALVLAGTLITVVVYLVRHHARHEAKESLSSASGGHRVETLPPLEQASVAGHARARALSPIASLPESDESDEDEATGAEIACDEA